MNSMLEILSFLDPTDIVRVGAVCQEYSKLVRHPSLWKKLSIENVYSLDMSGLSKFLSYTTDKLPLTSISLKSPTVTAGCCCGESTLCGSCCSVGICAPGSMCSKCKVMDPMKSKLTKLKSLRIHNVSFLSSCPFNTMLQSCSRLTKLDILNDLDVNLVVSGLAANCPQLIEIKFKYSHALDFGTTFRQSHSLLRPQVAETFVSSCPNVQYVSFSHYTVDEDCVRCLLELEHVLEADFSDNENLSGAFLVSLPTRWVNLQKLVMRDCSELDDDFVHTFASMLSHNCSGTLKYCHNLVYADFSCQWAFHGHSFIGDGCRSALRSMRGDSLKWREDQCEVPDFGIDPESGIDGIEADEDDIFEHLMSESSFVYDVPVPSVALDEALANVNNTYNSPTHHLTVLS